MSTHSTKIPEDNRTARCCIKDCPTLAAYLIGDFLEDNDPYTEWPLCEIHATEFQVN
jgi:hypothetical protein